jgi:hypothetical protein
VRSYSSAGATCGASEGSVVELGATDDAAALHLDGFDHRRQQREHAFHALAEGDLADGEVLVDAGPRAGDADAFVGLDPLALAFLDAHVHADGVAGLEVRGLAGGEALGLFLLELFDHVHGRHSLPGLTAPFAC